MQQALSSRETRIRDTISACREVASRLASDNLQPLHREASLVMAELLKMDVEKLGIGDEPDVQKLFRAMRACPRPVKSLRRFPQDFI